MRFKDFYLSEMLGKKYDYSCLLFDFPEEISQEIQSWTRTNIKDEELVKDGRENETHVTILYGIHTANASECFLPLNLAKSVDVVKPFEVTFGNITKFDAPDCDVLKIDVRGLGLHKLRYFLEKTVENTQSHSEYRPHVTLAYVAKNSCDRFIESDFFAGRKVIIDAIDFSSKDGTRQRIQLK